MPNRKSRRRSCEARRIKVQDAVILRDDRPKLTAEADSPRSVEHIRTDSSFVDELIEFIISISSSVRVLLDREAFRSSSYNSTKRRLQGKYHRSFELAGWNSNNHTGLARNGAIRRDIPLVPSATPDSISVDFASVLCLQHTRSSSPYTGSISENRTVLVIPGLRRVLHQDL